MNNENTYKNLSFNKKEKLANILTVEFFIPKFKA